MSVLYISNVQPATVGTHLPISIRSRQTTTLKSANTKKTSLTHLRQIHNKKLESKQMTCVIIK